MDLKKILNYLSILFGGLLALVGAGFVVMYVWEAIFARIGEPDQSLIFWYLPVLFLGVIGIMLGWTLLVRGLSRLRKNK